MPVLALVFSISLVGLLLLIMNSILFLSRLSGKGKLYLTLTIYLIALSVVETFCNIMGFLNPNSNLFLSHFYFNFQFLFLSFFYYKLFKTKILKKLVGVTFIVVWIVLAVQYYLNPALFWQFNLPEILSISFILIIYSLIHLYNNLGEKKRYFYFAIGLIMYLLCSSIIFMSGNLELVFWQDPYIDIWIFNSLLYIVYQLLIFKEWKLLKLKTYD
jgi:hypothetical protein